VKRSRWWIALGGLTAIAFIGIGCQGEETTSERKSEASLPSDPVFTAAQVRREFRRHGLPLTELTSDRPDARVFNSERAGPVFRVDVYSNVSAAAAGESLVLILRPANYRLRGQVMNRRKANVVVMFEQGRPSVLRRLDAALADLE
jgi:hypothetical protein